MRGLNWQATIYYKLFFVNDISTRFFFFFNMSEHCGKFTAIVTGSRKIKIDYRVGN